MLGDACPSTSQEILLFPEECLSLLSETMYYILFCKDTIILFVCLFVLLLKIVISQIYVLFLRIKYMYSCQTSTPQVLWKEDKMEKYQYWRWFSVSRLGKWGLTLMLMQFMGRSSSNICPWHLPKSHGLQGTNIITERISKSLEQKSKWIWKTNSEIEFSYWRSFFL